MVFRSIYNSHLDLHKPYRNSNLREAKVVKELVWDTTGTASVYTIHCIIHRQRVQTNDAL
jgi:hypothetical protein